MVEEVSPIIYKKLFNPNMINMEQEIEEEYEEQEQDEFEEENIITTSKTKSNINKKKLNEPRLFYDKVSKQIIFIGKSGIKIFNKNLTRLKKEIILCLNPLKIFSVAVSKQINYMLIFLYSIINKWYGYSINNWKFKSIIRNVFYF